MFIKSQEEHVVLWGWLFPLRRCHVSAPGEREKTTWWEGEDRKGRDQSLDAGRFPRMDHVLNSQAEPCGCGAPTADLCLPLPGCEGRGSGMKFSSITETYGKFHFYT